jgi:hypothetical protein
MPFDTALFARSELPPRTADVPVPALSVFFSEGEAPVWRVRGLTATELHKALEAGKRQGAVDSVARAIAANADQVATIRRALGLSSDTPGDIAKRLEMMVMGSVAPVVDLPTAVKLAGAFPVEFMQITNEITELTGKGADLGKVIAASQPSQN